MIEVSIAHDKLLNKLSVFAQLIYLKALPHTDDYGRFEGDPEIFKARVDPLSNGKVDHYERAMREIADSGLWLWYDVDGRKVVQYKQDAFERINAFLIKKRGNPEYPEYKDGYKPISSDIQGISHSKYKATSNKQKVESKKSGRPESLLEAGLYFQEIGLTLEDGGEFWNYYEANGWVQGRQGKPIVDWKAAARHWKSNKGKFNGSTQSGNSKPRQSEQLARATFRHGDEEKKRIAELAESLRRRDADRLARG
jgi:hypothetical protein